MATADPDISVVIATHDRPARLEKQLESLRRQTLAHDRYEVIVVDDASGPETAALLEREARRPDGHAIQVLRHERSLGPAAARNHGWRSARAPLIAFTDDDCEAPPHWLAAGLAAAAAEPGAFVQGPIAPIPDEHDAYGPFSHTVIVTSCGPGFETANIFYPRALLERLGGFDEVSYTGPGGEDTDLAWQAIEELGVNPVWAPDALMYHAVSYLGPIGKLKRAAHWHESMLPFKRYPALRKHRYGGVFWNQQHWWLARAGLALFVPARLWWLRWWLSAPYVMHLTNRRSGPLLAPYLVIHDIVEMSACIRGSVRYRILVI
jgi:glycosyltransferase involved in cell wall biosynthesis